MTTASVILTPEQIKEVFINTPLEENYNFLEADLVKLANAIILKAKPAIERNERTQCIQFVRSLNHLVADRLEQKRGKM